MCCRGSIAQMKNSDSENDNENEKKTEKEIEIEIVNEIQLDNEIESKSNTFFIIYCLLIFFKYT